MQIFAVLKSGNIFLNLNLIPIWQIIPEI